jgi:hypothetical protein
MTIAPGFPFEEFLSFVGPMQSLVDRVTVRIAEIFRLVAALSAGECEEAVRVAPRSRVSAQEKSDVDTKRVFMTFTKALVTCLLAIASACAVAADARERGFLREGMAEGEVLFKVGKPDHEAFVQNVQGQPEEKTWTYFPDPRDPQTLTIVTLRAGVVANIERKIAR